MNKRIFLRTFLVSALCLAACGKKQETPAPDLAPPKKVLVPQDSSSIARDVPAEAEVTASSGPVQLTLRLYKTKIKAASKYPAEDYLRFQIELKNIGKEQLPVADPVFFGPWNIKIKGKGVNPPGIYLHLIGPDGRTVGTSRGEDFNPECLSKEDRESFENHTKKIAAVVSEGDKKGLTDEEIHLNITKVDRRSSGKDSDSPLILLEPGESAKTAPYARRGQCDKRDSIPPPNPIGGFAELSSINFLFPGKYTIRAVYDNAPLGDDAKILLKDLNLPPMPVDKWEVRVKTPSIDFEVLP